MTNWDKPGTGWFVIFTVRTLIFDKYPKYATTLRLHNSLIVWKGTVATNYGWMIFYNKNCVRAENDITLIACAIIAAMASCNDFGVANIFSIKLKNHRPNHYSSQKRDTTLRGLEN